MYASYDSPFDIFDLQFRTAASDVKLLQLISLSQQVNCASSDPEPIHSLNIKADNNLPLTCYSFASKNTPINVNAIPKNKEPVVIMLIPRPKLIAPNILSAATIFSFVYIIYLLNMFI